MSASHYRRLFAFDAWANGAVADGLSSVPEPPPAAVRWLAHIAAALDLWLLRIEGSSRAAVVWPDLALDDARAYLDTVTRALRGYMAALTGDELERSVAYVNSKGESHESRVADILMHLVLHGAHHRGQIATACRTAGIEPVYVDFIHAARQGFLSEDEGDGGGSA